jgi:hypothetical protein
VHPQVENRDVLVTCLHFSCFDVDILGVSHKFFIFRSTLNIWPLLEIFLQMPMVDGGC